MSYEDGHEIQAGHRFLGLLDRRQVERSLALSRRPPVHNHSLMVMSGAQRMRFIRPRNSTIRRTVNEKLSRRLIFISQHCEDASAVLKNYNPRITAVFQTQIMPRPSLTSVRRCESCAIWTVQVWVLYNRRR